MNLAQPSTLSNTPASTIVSLKLLTMALLWGGTFTAGKVVTQSLPLHTAAFCRFLIAAILLLWLVKKSYGRLPILNRFQLCVTALLGFCGVFLYNVFFFSALSIIPAGRTALFVSLTPVLTALLASVIFRERLSLTQWLGILVASTGALIVVSKGALNSSMPTLSHSFGWGELMMILAVLSWAGYTLLSRIAMQTLSPLVATCYATIWGLLFLSRGALGEFSAIDWLNLPPTLWLSLLYLGALGTVLAFIWYYEGIRELGPSRTAVYTNLVPAFGVLLSAILLDEEILVSMLIGGAILILGVWMTNRVSSVKTKHQNRQ